MPDIRLKTFDQFHPTVVFRHSHLFVVFRYHSARADTPFVSLELSSARRRRDIELLTAGYRDASPQIVIALTQPFGASHARRQPVQTMSRLPRLQHISSQQPRLVYSYRRRTQVRRRVFPRRDGKSCDHKR